MANFYYHKWTGSETEVQYPFPSIPPFPDTSSTSYWTALPEPSKFTFNLAEIDADSAGRMADGTMKREVLATKRSLNFEWPALNNNDISGIYSALASTPGTEATYFLALAYPDAATGTVQTKIFYCGDRSTPAYNFNNEIANHGTQQNPDYRYWTGLTVNLIER